MAFPFIPILFGMAASGVYRGFYGYATRYSEPLYRRLAGAFGYGGFYAGGTTVGYHANPLNWRRSRLAAVRYVRRLTW